MATKKRRPKIGRNTRLGPMRQFIVWLYQGSQDIHDAWMPRPEHLANMRGIAGFWFSTKSITLVQRDKLLAQVDAAEQEAA